MGCILTDSDLIRGVSRETGLKQEDVKKVVRSIESLVHSFLKQGEKVQIQGVGTLDTRVRVARQGRNFKTGELMTVPERRVIKFTPAKALKQSVA